MKYGAELEFFLMKGNTFVFPKDYTFGTDGYPLLGEIRTGVHTDPFLLVGELMGLILATQTKAQALGVKMILKPVLDIPLEIRRAAIRRPEVAKEPEKQLNLYGYSHSPKEGKIYAGLHVHFSGHETMIYTPECPSCHNHKELGKTYQLLPMPLIIRTLDLCFGDDVRNAERVVGSYEMKSHGFEYRSLPNNINLTKLAKALYDVERTING